MVRQSVVDKWIEELDEYIPYGIDNGHYSDPDRLNDELADTIAHFCDDHKYSERTSNEMLDCIPVRDAFYKMLSEMDFTLPTDAEIPSKEDN